MARPFHKILCPVYFDETSSVAVEYARHFASQDDGTVYLFHAVPTDELHLLRKVYHPQEHGGADVIRAEQVARDRLAEIAHEHLKGTRHEIVTARQSDSARGILEAEEKVGVDLVVMATHGRTGIAHLMLGSVAEKVVRESKRPVFTTRRGELLSGATPFQKILAPVDISDQANAALVCARQIAEQSGGVVYPLHIVPTDETELLLHDVYEAREDKTNHKVNAVVAEKVARRKLTDLAERHLSGMRYHPELQVSGDPAKTILEVATGISADLIVMTTHGVSGFFHLLLGSITEKMMREAACPVLAFRQ